MEDEEPERLCLPKIGETLREGQEIATEIIEVCVECACLSLVRLLTSLHLLQKFETHKGQTQELSPCIWTVPWWEPKRAFESIA
jgi:hypothetical protein